MSRVQWNKGWCGNEAVHDPHGPLDARRCEGTATEDVARAHHADEEFMVITTSAIGRAEWDALGPRAHQIITVLIPEFVSMFVEANLHYGDDNPAVLGPAGQFSDIWRKIGPLRRALWEGAALKREDVRTILLDLIGHALLTVEMLDSGVPRRGGQPKPLDPPAPDVKDIEKWRAWAEERPAAPEPGHTRPPIPENRPLPEGLSHLESCRECRAIWTWTEEAGWVHP